MSNTHLERTRSDLSFNSSSLWSTLRSINRAFDRKGDGIFFREFKVHVIGLGLLNKLRCGCILLLFELL